MQVTKPVPVGRGGLDTLNALKYLRGNFYTKHQLVLLTDMRLKRV